MIRRPPRSTLDRSSAASDVYKRQAYGYDAAGRVTSAASSTDPLNNNGYAYDRLGRLLSLIHISEPTRPY
mgnify:CR=1 FL=1